MQTKTTILYTLASFSTLLLLAFIVFVAFYEVYKGQKSFTWASVATPFNILSLIGITSSIGYNLLEALASRVEFDKPQMKKYRLGASVFEAVWAISYLYFSWIRAEKQIQSIFPKTFRVIRALFNWSPVLVSLPTVLVAVQVFVAIGGGGGGGVTEEEGLFEHLQSWSSVSGAATFILLDCVFLFSFTRYLTHTQVEEDSPIDPRFLIISRYGCGASGLCLVLLSFSIAFSVTVETNGSMLVALGLGMVSAVLAPLVYFVLFCMKIALWNQSSRELEVARARLKKAKMESDATIFVPNTDKFYFSV
ncbi:UNVERIFIED_CONTAM: hypothetical protein HDU68_011650 [Siphonaria sp. JEL0065]|nr:hypothetical protein HDU68_011650 [Siphonaria sp. JEL0065]